MLGQVDVTIIPIEPEEFPVVFSIAIDGRTYSLDFDYNEDAGFFTVTIATASVVAEDNEVLIYGEPLRYGARLFSASPDPRLPTSHIVPLCLDGDDISEITWANFGREVSLCIFPRAS